MAAKKATVQVPTSLDEITLGQYQEFLKAQEDNQNEYFLQIKAIEIFCLVPEKDVKMIMAKDVKKISDKIINLFKGDHELVKSFKLNGIEYGFISSMDEMSFGEYVDLDTNISDWKTMFISMAVLYRPIAHRSSGRYEVEEYDAKTPDRALAFPMSAVLGSLFFLFNTAKDLLLITQSYLRDQVVKQQAQSANSDKSLDGIQVYMDLVEGTFSKLKLSQN